MKIHIIAVTGLVGLGLVLVLEVMPAWSGQKPTLHCPSGIGSTNGDAPKLQSKTRNGLTLMVCGYSQPDSSVLGDKIFSEFGIYVHKAGQITGPIFEVGALYNYAIQTDPKSGELSLHELAFIESASMPNGKKHWLPLFKSKTVCNKSDCSLTKPVCALKKPKTVPLKTSPLSVNQAFYAAVSGDKPAREYFLKTGGGNLDGHAAEEFGESLAWLNRLIEDNCLK